MGIGLPPVDLFEERGKRRRDHVDDVFPQRLAGAVVRGVAHHRLSGRRVPSVLPGELGDVRRGVVDHLLAQVLAELLAGRGDRRGRADVRLRRHREHVGRLPDHGTRGVRARSGRRDVDDYGHLRREHRLHDLAHRGAQPTGRVELDHDRRVAVLFASLELVLDVALRDRIDVVVELHDEHARSLVGCRGGQCEEDDGGRCREEAAERSRDGRVHASNVPARVAHAAWRARVERPCGQPAEVSIA